MPIAPEPTTNKDFGNVLGTIASLYVQINSPSACNSGKSRARAPVARIICAASKTSDLPSFSTWTLPPPLSLPAPSNRETLFFLRR